MARTRRVKNFKVRKSDKVEDPIPNYDCGSLHVTAQFHYGGIVNGEGILNGYDNAKVVADYVGPTHISVNGIQSLCSALGFFLVKAIYMKQESAYVLLQNDHEITAHFLSCQLSRTMVLFVDCEGRINTEQQSMFEGEDQEVEEENEQAVEGADEVEEEGDLEYFSDDEYGMEEDREMGQNVNESVVERMLFEAQCRAGEKTKSWSRKGSLSKRKGQNEAQNEGTSMAGGDVPSNVQRNNTFVVETEDVDAPYESLSDEGSENLNLSCNELDSECDSEEERQEKTGNLFDIKDIFNPKFELGLRFTSKTILRDAIHADAINQQRSVHIFKNDRSRMYARCDDRRCLWRLSGRKIKGEESTFRINNLKFKHGCPATKKSRNMKSSFLAKKYIHLWKSDPKRSVKGFSIDTEADTGIHVSINQAYRAKILSLAMLNGSSTEQYAALWDFKAEVERSNPGSTVLLSANNAAGENKFDRIYMCLSSLRQGFLYGCRRIIGVDGAHLKGPHKGILLTAVGIDANNNIYPFAWAVVDKEDGRNWEWFLEVLKLDLHITRNDRWTFMSDKQKGLLQAFRMVFPGSVHRFCVRHLHGNFKRASFTGDALKDALWKAARATTVNEFVTKMEELKVISPQAHKWLEDKPPQHCSRSHFDPVLKCDMLLNNGCEAFNSCILDARKMPILSMLEWIMQYLMTRHQKNRDRARSKWKSDWCPKINKIVWQLSQIHVKVCRPVKSDDTHYSVQSYNGDTYAVDLEEKKCGCRKWDISGIPCVHAVSAIVAQGLDPFSFIHHSYSTGCYIESYIRPILPMNGRKEWKKMNYLPINPPNDGRAVGRPEGVRRGEPGEKPLKKKRRCRGKPVVVSISDPSRLTKDQRTVRCGHCKVLGHNKKGCAVRKESEAMMATDEAQASRSTQQSNVQATMDDDGVEDLDSGDENDIDDQYADDLDDILFGNLMDVEVEGGVQDQTVDATLPVVVEEVRAEEYVDPTVVVEDGTGVGNIQDEIQVNGSQPVVELTQDERASEPVVFPSNTSRKRNKDNESSQGSCEKATAGSSENRQESTDVMQIGPSITDQLQGLGKIQCSTVKKLKTRRGTVMFQVAKEKSIPPKKK